MPVPSGNPVGIPDPPVDQFENKATGKPWPGKFNSANCWASSISTLRAFVTKTKPLSPPKIRVLSGNLKRRSGWLEDDRKALLALDLHEGTDDPYVPSFQMYYGIGWERFEKKLENPLLAFTVPTDYDQIPDWLSESPTFDEGHSLTVFGGTIRIEDVGHGLGRVKTVLGHDPIHGKAKRYPLSIVRKAAEKIARSENKPVGTIYAVQARQAIPKPPPPPIIIDPPTDPGDLQQQIDVLKAQHLIDVAAITAAEIARDGAEDERDDAFDKLATIDAVQHPPAEA